MTTGAPLVVRVAMKPISTLMSPLQSVNLDTKNPEDASVERSDVCSAPAAAVIGEAVVAYELARPLDGVEAAPTCKTREQWISPQTAQKIVDDCGDGIVTAQPLVKRLSGFPRSSWHRITPFWPYLMLTHIRNFVKVNHLESYSSGHTNTLFIETH